MRMPSRRPAHAARPSRSGRRPTSSAASASGPSSDTPLASLRNRRSLCRRSIPPSSRFDRRPMRTILGSPTSIVVQAGENRVEVAVTILQDRNEVHLYRIRDDYTELTDYPVGPHHQVAHVPAGVAVHGLTVIA